MKTLLSILSSSALMMCLFAGTSYALYNGYDNQLTVVNNSACNLTITTSGYMVDMSTGFVPVGPKSTANIYVSIDPGWGVADFYFTVAAANSSEIVGQGQLIYPQRDPYNNATWGYGPTTQPSTLFTSTSSVDSTGGILTVTVNQVSGQPCPT